MTSDLLLGVDVGTSSTKGVVARPDGTVATAERLHHIDLPRPAWAEQDAEVWWEEFCQIARELVERAGAPPAAVCPSGMAPCLLAADADGRPVWSAILYGIDSRATREIGELTDLFGEEYAVYRELYPATRDLTHALASLQRTEPVAV